LVGLSAARVQAVRYSSIIGDMAKEPTIATQGSRRLTRPLSQGSRASMEARLRRVVAIQSSSVREPSGRRFGPCPNRFHLNSERNVHVESVRASNGDAELGTIEGTRCIGATDLTLEDRMIGNALELHDV
jgi:hypothetical protein